MKIAIPTEGKKGLDEQVSPHFGRAPTYTLFDTETSKVEVVENTSEHMGGVGLPPEILHELGAHAILCANLGHRAVMMFDERGIESYVGAAGTVRDALTACKDKRLCRASEESSCKEGRHEHHLGAGHDHGSCGNLRHH